MPRSRANRFQTITTQGGLLPPDVLKRVADLDGKLAGLTPEAYGEPEGFRLNEAIQRDWTQAQRHWKDFQRAREEIGVHDDTGELITRDRWVKPLLKLLGFGTLGVAKPRTLGSEEDGSLQSFRIAHFWQGEGGHEVPVHVTGFKQDLDRRTSGDGGGTDRIAPHGLVQLYLNRVDESLWAFCTNGLRWRILRDHAAISRPSLVEFDLEAMMDGEVYADFAIFWLCCHATSVQGQTPESCRLEQWCRVGEEQGTRVLEQLRRGVEDAIVALGRGFLAHPQNDELRRRLQSGELSTQELYRRLLRHVYRLLFLMVAEDRELLHPPAPEGDPAAAKAHSAACRLYDRHYSLRRLRELSAGYTGTRHGDLWEMLGRTFRYLGMDGGCPPLALPGLGSFLWDPASTEGLNASPPPGFETAGDEPDAGGSPASIANEHLLEAIRALAFTEEQGVRRAVDYRNLGSEELGSVYEGLLELVPTVTAVASEVEHLFSLGSADGNERKTSGSYYTPDSLVQLLLDSALEPVISDRLSGTTSNEEAERALLSITVCDPACGSGHFLIAAAHRLARRLAEIRTGEPEPAMAERQAALRDVIRHCIYGIDINPMAAELCKVSLWMESIAPGQPLTFLDHHIVVGNSLLGVTPTMLQEGIPDDAFKKVEGDEGPVCTRLKNQNANQRKARLAQQGMLPFDGDVDAPTLAETAAAITLDAEDSLAAVGRKQQALAELRRSDAYRRMQLACDAWAAAVVWEKTDTDDGGLCPTDRDVTDILARGDAGARSPEQAEAVRRYAAEFQFLHPHLAFPEVFPAAPGAAGGFGVVLANPPWEHVELKEQEWFDTRDKAIAEAKTGASRKRLIKRLDQSNPWLASQYTQALRVVNGVRHYLASSGRFRLCGRGRVNLYAVFTEWFRNAIGPRGRAGCIVPTGIATDDTTKFFFQSIVDDHALVSLYDFENRAKLFPAVDSRMKFCALTLAGAGEPVGEAEFSFFAHRVDDLADPERRFTLSAEDIRLLNPNTRTCPVFRTRRDAEITKGIYRRVPVLWDETREDGNPWGLRFKQGLFNMTSDSHLFHTREQLEAEGWELEGNVFVRGEERMLPLYEAKMIHQFNDRWATYENGAFRDCTPEERIDPSYQPLPRFWVSEIRTKQAISGANGTKPMLGWRDVTNSTNERTTIAASFPCAAAGNNLPLICVPEGNWSAVPVLIASLNSFVSDFVARLKVGGTHLNFFVFRQIPAIPPHVAMSRPAFLPHHLHAWIADRVLALNPVVGEFVSHDVAGHHEDQSRDCRDMDRVRHEIDAAMFHLFGIGREDASYILDTFPIVRRRDDSVFGGFKTKECIMQIYDEMSECIADGRLWCEGEVSA